MSVKLVLAASLILIKGEREAQKASSKKLLDFKIIGESMMIGNVFRYDLRWR